MMRALVTVAALTAFCALLLWTTHSATAQRIDNARATALRASLESLAGIQRLQSITALDQWPLSLCGGRTLIQARARGYGGAIELLLALQHHADGPVLQNLQVLRHQETPGIGDFIAERDSTGWLSRFIGATSGSLQQREPSLDAVSGATVTVAAIRRALNAAMTDAAATAAAKDSRLFRMDTCP